MENGKQWSKMEGNVTAYFVVYCQSTGKGKDIMELVNDRHRKCIRAIIVSLD